MVYLAYMKSLILSISLPEQRSLSQDICLDDLLHERSLISYRRAIESRTGNKDRFVHFTLEYRLP